MIGALDQAEATLIEVGDELDDNDRTALEDIIEEVRPKIHVTIAENPTYKERLTRANVAIPS